MNIVTGTHSWLRFAVFGVGGVYRLDRGGGALVFVFGAPSDVETSERIPPARRSAVAGPGTRARRARVLVIDNYDSFVYNLVQYLGELGAEPVVHRHDAVDARRARSPSSPTRCSCRPARVGPEDAGVSNDAIRALRRRGRARARRVPRSPVHRPALRRRRRARAARDARQDVEITPRRQGRVRRRAEPVHRDPLPLARRRARHGARRARGDGRERGRPRDGPAPPRAPDRGRAVPPRVDPHRVGPRPPRATSSALAPRLDCSRSRRYGELGAGRRSHGGRPSCDERRERVGVELADAAPARQRSAPSPGRAAAGSCPRTAPAGDGASSASAPRVAHRRRSGHAAQRGLAGPAQRARRRP